MSQQQLDGSDVDAGLLQVRSEAVTKRVRSYRLTDARVVPSLLTDLLNHARAKRPVCILS